MSLLLLVVLLLASPALVYAIGQVAPRAAGHLSAVISGAACAAVAAVWAGGQGAFTVAWIPSWNVRLVLEMDGLAAAYALTATGIGFVVAVYSIRYMPAHFEEEGRPQRGLARFHALLLLFMGAMVGLVVSRELYAIVVFWDLTAVVSFLLIGTDRHHEEARRAAAMAMIVTAGSALLLLLSAALLHVTTGTTLVDQIGERAARGVALEVAAAFVVLSALAKSAQVPLHFWLPRAMVAPTPVSSYLHSAAMVAAGVFLVSRLHPILAAAETALPMITVAGALSIAAGSVLALAAVEIKRVLAYSTIAQYGYVMVMLGAGSAVAAGAATFYVLAHAVAKSALFLTAGAAIEAFGGRSRLTDVGGLGARMPALAAGSAVAAATLSALPPTVGFFKDELFFKVALEHGPAAIAGAVCAATLTFAYTWRWWTAIFLGRARHELHGPPALLTLCVGVLAAAALGAGIAPTGFAHVAEAAAAVIVSEDASVEAAYHLEWRPEYTMALAAITAGCLLLVARRALDVAPWGRRVRGWSGPEWVYSAGVSVLRRVSDYLHDIEVRDLRDRTAAVLVPGGLLVLVAVVSRPFAPGFRVGALEISDLPLACGLVVAAFAAVLATRPIRHLALVVALSTVSYSTAFVFVMFGAPDVALVAVLIQTVVTLLLVAVFSLFRREVARRAAEAGARKPPRFRAVAWLAATASFAMTWAVLSWPASSETPRAYLDLAEAAHAKDVVTAVLADFRGLDTMGEATVVAIALVGVATLLRESAR